MRILRGLIMVALCLELAGCSLFGKKAPANSTPPLNRTRADAGATGTDVLGALPPDRNPPPANVSGLLAGQVIDSYNRHIPATYIQVSDSRDAGPKNPLEVAADSQGYFTIPGLEPGRHYQLTARARNGDRLMAGTTWATPPDPKVLIKISEDFASTTTPSLPAAPAWPGPNAASQPSAMTLAPQRQPAAVDQAWAPGHNPAADYHPYPSTLLPKAADLGVPIRGGTSPAEQTPAYNQTPPPLVGRRENIVKEDNEVAATNPTANIPPQGPLENGPPPAGGPLVVPGSTRVPSCVLTGKTLHNLALNDINGQPWEYQRDHRGKLTLIDFWGSWCIHCQHAIPHLKILQQKYGPFGLEVIGIDYEQNVTTQAQQIQLAKQVCLRREVNYRILLGGLGDCPVRSQFGVVNWPTLVLLDESGTIIWQGVGVERSVLQELENIIRKRLGG